MTRRRPRILLPRAGALLLTLLALAVAPAAAASAEAPDDPHYRVSTTSGPPGTAIGITGSCRSKVADATLYYGGARPSDYRVPIDLDRDPGGNVDARLVVPRSAPSGSYVLLLRCIHSDVEWDEERHDFTVTDAAPPPGPNVEDLEIGEVDRPGPGTKIPLSGTCRLFGDQPAGIAIRLYFINDGPFPLVAERFVPATADGTVATVFTIPDDVGLDWHRVEVSCRVDGVEFGGISRSLEFVEPGAPVSPSSVPPAKPGQPTSPAPRLPETGAPGPRTLGPIGLAMVASGCALVLASRRRLNR